MPPDPYGVPSRHRRTDPVAPAPQAMTPREVEQAVELAELKAALEAQRSRNPKTVPPTLSLGSPRWWAQAASALLGAGGLGVAAWSRVDPPKPIPDPAPIAAQASQDRACEERLARVEREVSTIRRSVQAGEDWFCGLLPELEVNVTRKSNDRPCIRPNVTRPINRPIRLPLTVSTPMPSTPDPP